jgi:hypothetical protein
VTLVYVLMSLVGMGLVGLGATLVATARPRWIILYRRNVKFQHRSGGMAGQYSRWVKHGLL